jgi:hypothetical protein
MESLLSARESSHAHHAFDTGIGSIPGGKCVKERTLMDVAMAKSSKQ